ncbi:hypothetical protein KAFR_0K02320 [Kazachstania africana CBS 2517]|uniref:Alpha-1,3/1,6-mannosyltransferase ALG2 n=1 Tax=Kazachstania africana (strain ATCC 22294 / BCRC 22015 / CBS 2517 / CECT 1963 / NBRC 1671 / NRRL Y-8276) TaxID=1071382 RepID=H2B1T7_KAZAF|nr:hypothetical protein KAFR_0K02320 [Kazachstania africana CBS 2517]CCF60587.1 hypothetical protein KAFR_0K02320 [Kazachstania africana CBS 2517]
MTSSEPTTGYKVAFIHPDLGIGGAERLVVDAALGLQESGNRVKIYTSHCDPNHCFEEVKDGTLKHQVYGDRLPTHLFGKFFILFANLRQLYLIFQLIWTGQLNEYDLFIVDQLSTGLPLIHMFSDAKILFYCHFPDQKLAVRDSSLRKLYRLPFDLLEQFTMSVADKVVVNSKFTRGIYKETLNFLNTSPEVIYPCVSTSVSKEIDQIDKQLLTKLINTDKDKFYLSINRFERKKNVSLALKAFALSERSKDNDVKLLICGGYDERVDENKEYLRELQLEAGNLKLSSSTIFYPEYAKNKDLESFNARKSKVIFLLSISGSLKELLLEKMDLLLYTPSFEHFGIVPLEAMKHGKPTLAVNSGGPLETIISYKPGENEATTTGWLREPDEKVWAVAIDESTKCEGIDFAKNGKERLDKYFSRYAMTHSFETEIEKFIWSKKVIYPWETAVTSLSFFGIHLLVNFCLPNQNWPFLLLAGVAIVIFRRIFWGIYFLFVFSLSYE